MHVRSVKSVEYTSICMGWVGDLVFYLQRLYFFKVWTFSPIWDRPQIKWLNNFEFAKNFHEKGKKGKR